MDENILNRDIDWSVLYNKIYDLSYKDSGTYRMLGIIITVPALLLLVFAPVISAVLLLTALFMFYSFYRNRSRKSLIIRSVITGKEIIEDEYFTDDDDKTEPVILHTPMFHIKQDSAEELGFFGPAGTKQGFPSLKAVKVPREIYDIFSVNDRLIMILTPSNELAAYYYGNDFTVLEKTLVIV